MYGISVRREQLRSSSLGGRRGHGKKCHIILLYGDAARRSLRKFILLHGTTRARRGNREGGFAYTALWELRNSGATGAPGMDSESPYVSPFTGDIFARGLRMNATSARYTGDDTRWNLSRVNRYDVIAAHKRMHRVPRAAPRLLRNIVSFSALFAEKFIPHFCSSWFKEDNIFNEWIVIAD